MRCFGPTLVTAAVLGSAALGIPASGVAQADGQRMGRAVTYHIAAGDPGSGYRPSDRVLAEWALEAWGRQSDPPLSLEAAPPDQASIRVHWVRADEGLYGEARVGMIDGRPVADVYIRADVVGLGPDIEGESERDPLFRDAIVYLTCVHEIGHAFGLRHTASFADIMYTFQFGGDFVEYFQRFRRQLDSWEDIRTASPFSPADTKAFRERRSAIEPPDEGAPFGR
jgi:hypothetical protein